MGTASAVLLDAGGECVLVDAGWPGKAGVVIDALGRCVADGELLPLAGGPRVTHVPGRCAGRVGLLCRNTGLLVAADAFIDVLGPTVPIGLEDAAEGRRSQRRLAELAPRAACFGHGAPTLGGGATPLRRAAAPRRAGRPADGLTTLRRRRERDTSAPYRRSPVRSGDR